MKEETVQGGIMQADGRQDGWRTETQKQNPKRLGGAARPLGSLASLVFGVTETKRACSFWPKK